MKARFRIWGAIALLCMAAFGIIAIYDVRHALTEVTQRRTQMLEGVTSVVAAAFPSDYKPLTEGSAPDEKTRGDRLRVLAKALQPLAEHVANAYPGVTVVVHVLDIDAVVAQGSTSGRTGMVGMRLKPDSPVWEVYQRGELVRTVQSMPRGRVVSVSRPVNSGDRVVASVSASHPQGDIISEVKEVILSRVAFLVLSMATGTAVAFVMWYMLRTDLERVKGSLKLKTRADSKEAFFLQEFRELVESAHPLVQDREFILSIFDHLRPGVVACDVDRQVTFVNDSLLQLTGYTRKELLGKPIGILAERDESGIPRLGKIAEVVELGQPTGSYRRRLIRRNGRRAPVELHSYPINGADGKVSGVVSLVYDLTSANAVHRLEQMSKFLLDSIKSGVMAIDQEYRIIVFNRMAEEVYGLRKEDVIGRNIDQVLPGVEPRYRLVQQCLEEGTEVRNQVQSRVLNGREMQLLTDSSLLRDLDGNSIGAVVVFRDVTELIQLQERVRRAEKLAVVGQLAAGAAHEIRNPLTSVRGFIQILHSRFKSSGREDEGRLAEVVLDEIDRIVDLIRDFLQLAKPPELALSAVDVKKVINSTLNLIQAEAQAVSVEVRKELTAEIPDIPADRERIRQVLINLCRNSLQAMEPGGVLTGRAGATDDKYQVLLEVEDTGSGIAPENISRVFDPFFTTKADGTGLGLAICHRIVSDHGGDMRIWSVPGRGTRITVCLPGFRELPCGNAGI